MRKSSLIFSLIILMTLVSTACSINNSTTDFAHERKTFQTNLIKKGPSFQSYNNERPPTGVSEVKYKSGNLDLNAWISQAPSDGKKRPAVVYIHGGFAFGSDDWADVKSYLDRGYIVMAPMLRGENGNPGYFEFFYGEVDDAIAAGRYLANQPYVDTGRIFLAGHSSGGTISMLVALMPSPFKAIASFGGSPDQKSFFRQWGKNAPFNLDDPKEISLRSPIKFTNSLKTPLYIYVGLTDSAYIADSISLSSVAKKAGNKCEYISINGDHFSSLEQSITESIKVFDTY